MESGGNPLIGSLVFLTLLILNGLLHAFCSALDNLNDSMMEEEAEGGNKKAKRICFYLDNPSVLSDSRQLISGLCYLISGAWCLPCIASGITKSSSLPYDSGYQFTAMWILAEILGYILMLCFGYAGEKIGGAKEDKAALFLCGICDLLIHAILPFRVAVRVFSGLFVRIFGVDPNKNLDEVSEDEIISMVDEGHEQGLIESSEAEMIHNIFEFTDKEAQDIMTHRKNMIMLSGEASFSEALDVMLDNNVSRFPVYMEDTDNIIGVVHIRDCMERMKNAGIFERRLCDIEGLIREISFIPETRNISDLFHSMQSEKNHMVIVVDEYGQTSGLVTMEDILEEIVGNIFDEYDEEELSITTLPDGSYLIRGMTPLEDVAELLDVQLPEDEYDTLNGYLISLIDRIPTEEDQIQVAAEGYQFEVTSVENKMIQTVHVTKLPEDELVEEENKE